MIDIAQLRSDALAARERGEPDEAAEKWRVLLDHAPDDWEVGLQLKQDMVGAERYPDSDVRFRRAARSLPDGEWLDHFAYYYTYHGSELAAIDHRAKNLLKCWPDEPRLHMILGDVAAQRRDWHEAARAYAEVLRLDAGQDRCIGKLAAARRYERLSEAGWPDTGEAYSIFVINLDQTIDRMDEISRSFVGTPVPMRRLAATRGDTVPPLEAARLTGQGSAPLGTLGCFLSHVGAWETLLAGDERCALIIEDDVIPFMALPARLGGLALPGGWDVVWVNDRMAPHNGTGAGFTVHPLASVIQAFWPDTIAPGADGYLISRSGARRLLDWVAADGMADDVDWRMVAYGLSPDDIAHIPAAVYARRELTKLAGSNRRIERLRGYVLHPPLIREVGLSSVRQNLDRDSAGSPEHGPC